MKRFLFLLVCLASCTSSTQERATEQDSSYKGPYEDFSEVTPFAIKEELRDVPITINGKRKTLEEYLSQFYAPDTFTANSPGDSINVPGYIITDAKVLEGRFFISEKKCDMRSVLFTSRGNFIDQEFYDLLFLTEEQSGEMALTSKETFDGSQGQTSTIMTVEREFLSVDKQCAVLKVTSSSEGGDINLHKDEWVEYFIADENGFHSILKLQLENTNIQDYEVSEDENQNSSTETRTVEMLDTHHNGLVDIAAHYVNKENENSITDFREVYTFNGNIYVRN